MLEALKNFKFFNMEIRPIFFINQWEILFESYNSIIKKMLPMISTKDRHLEIKVY